MKKFLTLLIVLGGSFLLAACASNGPSYNDLAGHRFVLVSANEYVFSNEVPPMIEFRSELQSDQLKVEGKMCNNFTGTAFYKDGLLQADGLAMTRAICNETTLNMLDIQIAKMFKQGIKVTKSGDHLMLKSGTTVLTYKQQDIMQ